MSLNAIISVSDKTNLDVLVPFLVKKGYTIYSTGGTFTRIKELMGTNDKQLFTIDSLTGFPEILGGRVKTLHPRVYGGILADKEQQGHDKDMKKHNLEYFSLVVVNLYPFQKTVDTKGDDLALCIENIDIGGVSLIRGASKNYKHTTLLSNPSQYNDFMKHFDILGNSDRLQYAVQGFQMTSEYDNAIHQYLSEKEATKKGCKLKYGLNPHQTPACVEQTRELDKDAFMLLNGSLGYINVMDMIHGWLTVRELEDILGLPASISMKHTSPAGVGVGNEIIPESLDIFGVPDELREQLTPTARAFIKARNGDPLSSFGDLIGISGTVDEVTARLIKREVCDGIVASDYSEKALEILMSKKGGKFIIIKMNMDYYETMKTRGWLEHKEMYGLRLTEPCNSYRFSMEDLMEKYGGEGKNGGDDEKMREILEKKRVDFTLAYTVLKYAQSNNISMVYNGQVLGLGCGQQNRVGCVRLAGEKANNWMLRHSPSVIEYYRGLPSDMKRQAKVNSVYDFIQNHEFSEKEMKELEKYDVSLGSDGFFPFPDNIEVANEYRVKYILQPGGSLADGVVQEACDKHGIMMLNTGFRMFYH